MRKANYDVKYIFTEVPQEKYVQRYIDYGIDVGEMLSAQLFLADNYDLSGNCTALEKIEEIKNSFGATQIMKMGDRIELCKNGERVAMLFLKENKEYVAQIDYYEGRRLIVSERYGSKLLYKDFYATVEENGKRYAKKVRTSFVNQDGVTVYDCLYGSENQETYIYPDGVTYTRGQLLEKFIIKLGLSEKDIIFIDRPSYFEYVPSLFRYGKSATLITFLHSDHYFERGEDPYLLYLNEEYYYWFKHSDKIDIMLVSTEAQKESLKRKLIENQCYVPRIEAIFTSGLEELRYPDNGRRKKSLVSVSRLDPRKKIDWTILSVIEAHKRIPEISLDIYGKAADGYNLYLEKIVADNNAEHYIRFMGHCDVCEIYKNYEAYITASLWETLGLSVMEAVGSGNAVIGLDVRYGNRLFVENGENGKLIDFTAEDVDDPEKIQMVIAKMADAIVELFQDEEALRRYQEHSYKIAERFLNEKIEKKWIELMESI